MAVTIHSSPATPTPCFNEQWIVASSTQTAQPNFTYTLIITDVITSTVLTTQQIRKDPNNQLVIDIKTYAKEYMVNYIPVNLYGWKKCANAIRKIRFNVGETYGATPVYYAGANTEYNVWNAGVDNINFAPYNVNAYTYDSGVPAYIYLTRTGSEMTYVDRSQYLYVNVQAGLTAEIPYITVKTYNAAGTLIAEYRIARPNYTTGTYTDQYQCIDVGYKGMLGISSGLVTVISGTYPIITASVASYTITDPTAAAIVKTITIGCTPRFDVYSLHYLNANGAYETLHCNLVAELTSTKTVTTFKKSGWSLISNVMTLDPALTTEKTQGVTLQDNLKLNSDWLSDAEFLLHKDLFASTDVRLDFGSSTTYRGVKVNMSGYTTKNNEKLRSLVIDLSYTHTNNRQIG